MCRVHTIQNLHRRGALEAYKYIRITLTSVAFRRDGIEAQSTRDENGALDCCALVSPKAWNSLGILTEKDIYARYTAGPGSVKPSFQSVRIYACEIWMCIPLFIPPTMYDEDFCDRKSRFEKNSERSLLRCQKGFK